MNGFFYFRQGGWSVHLVIDADRLEAVSWSLFLWYGMICWGRHRSALPISPGYTISQWWALLHQRWVREMSSLSWRTRISASCLSCQHSIGFLLLSDSTTCLAFHAVSSEPCCERCCRNKTIFITMFSNKTPQLNLDYTILQFVV